MKDKVANGLLASLIAVTFTGVAATGIVLSSPQLRDRVREITSTPKPVKPVVAPEAKRHTVRPFQGKIPL